MEILKQEGGDDSQNLQVNGNISIGITYSEARQIALDVFNANCQTLMSEAAQIADIRKNEIIDELIKRLYDEHPELSIRLKDPSIQYSLFSVIKNYVRTGDADLEEQLLRMLILRMESKDRSLEQIVLDEAIEVLPKLTQDQIDILSLVVSAIHITDDVNNLNTFKDYINNKLIVFYPVNTTGVEYIHLQYTGCYTALSEGATYKPIHEILRNRYGGLFSKGFTQELLEETFPSDYERITPIVTNCINDVRLKQFNAINESVLIDTINKQNLEDLSDRILQFHKQHEMNDEEIQTFLISINPRMKDLLEEWASQWGNLKTISLTSVGFAIAVLNFNVKTNSNLSIKGAFK